MKIKNIIRNFRMKYLRKRLINKNPTILANNCNGTFIYKDLGLKFNSPTINLFMSISDFVKFVGNLEHYLSLEVEEFYDETKNYPVGKLGDIQINFMHYDTFEQAKNKWIDRCKRIDKSNIYIIMNEGKGSKYEDLENFENLKYKNKVLFTHIPYPELKSAFYIKGYEDKETCDFLFNYMPNGIKRYYEQFDYVKFLNQKID